MYLDKDKPLNGTICINQAPRNNIIEYCDNINKYIQHYHRPFCTRKIYKITVMSLFLEFGGTLIEK
jgi:hypothetical protein